MDKDHICLLLFCADGDDAELRGECEDLLPVAEGLSGIRLRFAVGGLHGGAQEVSAAYAETLLILKRHMRDADTRVLTSAPAAERQDDYRDSFSAETLRNALQDGQEAAVRAQIEASLRHLRGGTIYDARSFGMGLAAKCRRIESWYDRALKPKKLHELEVEILSCETFLVLHDTLMTLLSETAAMIDAEGAKISQLIRATDAYIDAHYTQRVSLQDIAAGVHANACYLSRFYKEKTGENLFDVINGKKVQRACELLLAGEMKSYEIAEAVGFSDTSYFSKFFKRHTGLTPRDYVRRKHGGEEQGL